MAIIKPQQLEQLIKSKDKKMLGVLLHGANADKIKSVAKSLVATIAGSTDDPFNVVFIDETKLKETPGILRDEMMSLSFTGNRKVVWVRDPGPALTRQLSGLFDNLEDANLLVVEAGQLKKTAAIRKVFETTQTTAAIAYYDDTPRDLSNLIITRVQSAQMEIESAATALLLETIGSNRGMVETETEKLICFCLSKKQITVADIKAVCNDPLNDSLDILCDRTFCGDLPGGLEQFRQLLSAGVDPGYIMNTIDNHIHRLLSFRLNTNKSGNLDGIIRSARPPVFFKRQDTIKKQVGMWQETPLKRAIVIIFEAIRLARTSPEISQEICERALISIGKSVSNSPRY